jgi:hypothetical protein
MNRLTQNDMEWLEDMIQRGEMTVERANIEKVRMARVLVVSKLPAMVRASLNSAVKTGELCHKKKNGRKPEVYYHPNFEHLANEERNSVEKQTLEALAGVIARTW